MKTITPIEFRRHLHRYPELSYQEHATQRYIMAALDALGITYRSIAKSGVLAVLEGRGDLTRAVVLRADIDALPITEANDLEFKSENDGVMHACGHDIHAAVLYGVLQKLTQGGNDFEGTIFGLFQPGEELNPGGASLVLTEEPFADYDVIAVIGEHVEAQLPVGTLGFRAGKYMASSDEIRFNINGVGGHGAMRPKVKDPVQAASDYLLRLLQLNSDELILSIGKVVADGATNVIPATVYLEGTMRTFDEEVRATSKIRIAEIAREVEQRWDGISIEVNISQGYPCVTNDATLTALAITEASKSLAVAQLDLRTTSEDFGFYTTRYPSLFYRLGAGTEQGVGAPHTATFCPSEGAITVGIEFMTHMARKISRL